MINSSIRFATESDYAEMLAIYDYYVKHTSITFDHETPSLEAFDKKIQTLQKQYPVIVYEIDKRIVGYAYASSFREKRAYQWSVETTIYLEPTCKSKGIGSLLYHELFELLKKQKIRFAIAVVTIPNDESIHFHKKFDFKECGFLDQIGYKMNQWWSIAYLQKTLLDETAEVMHPISITEINQSKLLKD